MKKLGFGFMRLPLKNKDDPTSIDVEAVKEMADLFLANGFTYFDTAYPYHKGESEKALRAAVVERYPRDSFTIADKLPMFSMPPAERYEPIFQEQLERLGTDYIDYYLLHNIHAQALEHAEKTGAFDFVARKKAEGKVRNIGFSMHDSPERMDEVLTRHPEMDFVQIQLNYLDWENAGIQARRCYEVCRKHNKPIIIMEPVKGGTLCDLPDEVMERFRRADPKASAASWAIRFAAGLEGVMTVLSGMSNLEQVRDNVSYMKNFRPLSPGERDIVRQVTEAVNASIAIPCTGCGYCLKGCPKHIPISTYFALYNVQKQDTKKAWKSQEDYYDGVSFRSAPAKDCIKCGHCESMCPQHLKIRDYLEQVSAEFDR